MAQQWNGEAELALVGKVELKIEQVTPEMCVTLGVFRFTNPLGTFERKIGCREWLLLHSDKRISTLSNDDFISNYEEIVQEPSTHSWFTGFCKKCGFNVVVMNATNAPCIPKEFDDYYWYCSNPKCTYHKLGSTSGDQEQPAWVSMKEERVPE